jgi:isopenicillin-N N-acyltransferase-like protein
MFPLISVSGTPYERGRQYGVAAAARVRHSIASYARLFAHRRGLDWPSVQAEAERYRALLVEVAPDLLEEMRGIADGAGEPVAAILALNVRTELMAGVPTGFAHPEGPAALARNRALGVPQHADEAPVVPVTFGAHSIDDGECTTVAAQPATTAHGGTLLAQTWDWQGDQRGACVLLRVEAPGQPALLTMTEAGMLAKIGINSAGVAVGLNLLRSHSDGREVGMPVHVLLRKMLQAGSFAEARALADLALPGGSSCVTLASAAGDLVSLELTPAGVAEVWPEEGLLVHANHCVDAGAAADECPHEAISTSYERYDRAAELLRAGAGAIDVALLQAILRDRENAPRCICRSPNLDLPPVDRGESVCGIVIDLDARVMHVAPDVPSEVAFTPVALYSSGHNHCAPVGRAASRISA